MQDRADESRNTVDDGPVMYFCDDCKVSMPLEEKLAHVLSIGHNIARKSEKAPVVFGIPSSNKGFKMLKSLGWQGDTGLGNGERGRLFPVATVFKNDQRGLGASSLSRRVTHFPSHRDGGGSEISEAAVAAVQSAHKQRTALRKHHGHSSGKDREPIVKKRKKMTKGQRNAKKRRIAALEKQVAASIYRAMR